MLWGCVATAALFRPDRRHCGATESRRFSQNKQSFALIGGSTQRAVDLSVFAHVEAQQLTPGVSAHAINPMYLHVLHVSLLYISPFLFSRHLPVSLHTTSGLSLWF